MRICHVSDSHWGFYKYPKADLYVFTGDEYDNYLRLTRVSKRMAKKLDLMGQDGHGGSYIIDRAHEARMQRAAAAAFVESGGMRQHLGSPDSPIVCVRGNHDFTDLAPLFEGCNLVHEFVNNEIVEVAGLKVTGHRGVPPINGAWNDETSEPDLRDRFKSMDPSCDLYLTHYPAGEVGLDLPGRWGLDGVDNWFYYQGKTKYPIHMFGHIHECGGMAHRMGDVWYSNAARCHNVFDGSPETGWEHMNLL